jgi:hypothetical protein
MRHQVQDVVDVSLDSKVEPPIAIDSGLPHVLFFVELFSPQRRVLEILQEQLDLLIKSSLDGAGCAPVAFGEPPRARDSHRMSQVFFE